MDGGREDARGEGEADEKDGKDEEATGCQRARIQALGFTAW
jgi:hypothetical protein